MNIDDIKKALECCYYDDNCEKCPNVKNKGYGCIDTLFASALNLITEQEKEIERLEEKCEELLNEKWDAQDDLDCYYDEMPSKIKQAKIDVLNKVKERACGLAAIETYHIRNLIDELINEERK